MKILTTMDFIVNYPNVEEFKGNSLQILTTDTKLDIDLLNKFYASSVVPEFVVTTEENMEYLTGYIMGRTLQGANSIILLTDKPYEMSALAHKKAVISNNFKEAKAILDKVEKEDAKIKTARKKETENTAATSENKADEVPAADVKQPDEAPAMTQPPKKRGRKKKSELMAMAAASEETDKGDVSVDVENADQENTANEAGTVAAEPDYSEIKKILEDCGAINIAKEYGISEDDLFAKVADCVNMSFEVVSYETQLGIRFLNQPFCKAFYGATKKSYDLLKKASAKARQ